MARRLLSFRSSRCWCSSWVASCCSARALGARCTSQLPFCFHHRQRHWLCLSNASLLANGFIKFAILASVCRTVTASPILCLMSSSKCHCGAGAFRFLAPDDRCDWLLELILLLVRLGWCRRGPARDRKEPPCGVVKSPPDPKEECDEGKMIEGMEHCCGVNWLKT